MDGGLDVRLALGVADEDVLVGPALGDAQPVSTALAHYRHLGAVLAPPAQIAHLVLLRGRGRFVGGVFADVRLDEGREGGETGADDPDADFGVAEGR